MISGRDFLCNGKKSEGGHSRKMAPQGDECYSSLISSGHQYRFSSLVMSSQSCMVNVPSPIIIMVMVMSL